MVLLSSPGGIAHTATDLSSLEYVVRVSRFKWRSGLYALYESEIQLLQLIPDSL